MTTPNAIPPIEPTTSLKCPNCDYDLTGLHSNACPECGLEFRVRQFVEFGDRRAAPYLLISIIMILFTGPLGVIPLVFSIRTIHANERHDFISAWKNSRRAFGWNVSLAIIGGTAFVVGALVG